MSDKLRKLEEALNAVESAVERAAGSLVVQDMHGTTVLNWGDHRIQARAPLGVAFSETIQELSPVIETLVRHKVRKLRVAAETALADACREVLNGTKAD